MNYLSCLQDVLHIVQKSSRDFEENNEAEPSCVPKRLLLGGKQGLTTKSPIRLTSAGSLKNLLFVLQCLLLLSSCNLRAVYNQSSSPAINQLNAITIQDINSVAGTELVYHLSSLLPRKHGVKVKYILNIEFSNNKSPSILQKNSDSLREIVDQVVRYKLIDIQTNRTVTEGKFNHITTYRVDSAVYSSYTLGELGVEELTKRAAEEIISRLILYFESIG